MLRVNSHKFTHNPIKKERRKKKKRSEEETSNLSLVSDIC